MPSKASQSWKTLISFDIQLFHQIQQSINRDLSAKVVLEEFSLSSSAHCGL